MRSNASGSAVGLRDVFGGGVAFSIRSLNEILLLRVGASGMAADLRVGGSGRIVALFGVLEGVVAFSVGS